MAFSHSSGYLSCIHLFLLLFRFLYLFAYLFACQKLLEIYLGWFMRLKHFQHHINYVITNRLFGNN